MHRAWATVSVAGSRAVGLLVAGIVCVAMTGTSVAAESHHHSKATGTEDHSGDRTAPKSSSSSGGGGATLVPQAPGAPAHDSDRRNNVVTGPDKPATSTPADRPMEDAGRRKADRHTPNPGADADHRTAIKGIHNGEPPDRDAGDRRGTVNSATPSIEQLQLDAAEGERRARDARKIAPPSFKPSTTTTINPQWVARLHRQPLGLHEWPRRNAIGMAVTTPTLTVSPGLVHRDLPAVVVAPGQAGGHPGEAAHTFVPIAAGTPPSNPTGLGGAPRINGTGLGHMGIGPATLGGRAKNVASINGTGFRAK